MIGDPVYTATKIAPLGDWQPVSDSRVWARIVAGRFFQVGCVV